MWVWDASCSVVGQRLNILFNFKTDFKPLYIKCIRLKNVDNVESACSSESGSNGRYTKNTPASVSYIEVFQTIVWAKVVKVRQLSPVYSQTVCSIPCQSAINWAVSVRYMENSFPWKIVVLQNYTYSSIVELKLK